MNHTLTATAIVAAGLLGPAATAAPGVPSPQPGLGIRLTEAPADLANDPRAQIYIVDHVAPGATIQRKVEVSDGTDAPMEVTLYASGAKIAEGSFTPVDGASDIGRWTVVSPATVSLSAGEKRIVEVKISVPRDASFGERYGAIWAQMPPQRDASGVTQVNRVGIRVYLDVGKGGAPASDFAITTLTAARAQDGSPVVQASVKNTGGRALDMSGQLWLRNGPGGLSAGPFPAQLGTTLGIGQEEPVTVKLDKRLPAGPWLAHLELQSDLIKHAAEATITFPTQAGTVGKTVEAKAVPLTKNKQVLGIVAGSIIGLVLVGILIFLFLLWKRRGEDEDDGKRRSGPPNVPQPRAKESLRDRVRR